LVESTVILCSGSGATGLEGKVQRLRLSTHAPAGL